MPQDPQPNRPDGTTVVPEIVVTGRQTFEGYKVLPPFPQEVIVDGPLDPDAPEAPEFPGELDEECKRQAALNRAALEAARLVGSEDDEFGYVLVRQPDGSVQAIGPIPSESDEGDDIPWRLNPDFYGLTDLSNVVGIVHNHPSRPITGDPYDRQRPLISPRDVLVTSRFLESGVNPDFRQFIVVEDVAYVFGNDAEAGDEGTIVQTIECPGAQLP